MWTVPLLESFKQPQCSWTVLCCILAVLLWFVSQASYCLFTDESCPVFVFVFVSGLRLLSYTEMIKQKWIFSLGVPPGDLPTLLWEWGAKVLCSLVWDNRNKKIKKKFVSQNCRWQRMIESWLVDLGIEYYILDSGSDTLLNDLWNSHLFFYFFNDKSNTWLSENILKWI